MAKYNLYLLRQGKVDELTEKLLASGYRKTTTSNIGDYELAAFFTAKPKPTEIWWLTQYSNFFPEYLDKWNAVYSAAIIAVNQKSGLAFLIALGKTHFYVQEFIDYTFGLRVAERIGIDREAKSKSSKRFAGQTSKSMVSFSGNTPLSFSPGEATDYVKLKVNDASIYGKAYVHFGTSVQFSNAPCLPSEMNVLLSNLEACLQRDAVFKLPCMIPVKDEGQIIQLDSTLSQAIDEDDARVGIVDFELYGVDFVFSQQTHARLQFQGILSDPIPELDIDAVKKFTADNGLSLSQSLRMIKVKTYVNDDCRYTVDLVNLIDYAGDGNSFLHRGKWYIFSDSYLENLRSLIDTVALEPIDMRFTSAELDEWSKRQIESRDAQRANGVKVQDVIYRERYVLGKMITANPALIDMDRNLDYRMYNGKKAKLEVSDIYDPSMEELIVVKVGEAKDFGYAFDQANLTLNLTKANQYNLENGATLQVKRLRLILISPRVNVPRSVHEINSLSFRLKLGGLMELAKEKNIELVVSFAKYAKSSANESPQQQSDPGVRAEYALMA